jgi:hypothetical protein
VLGSNQRRLSRRFYRPPLLSESHVADQRIRRPRRVSGPPPSAMRPWTPGSGPVRSTDGYGPAHGRERKRPRTGPVGAVMLTILARITTLTCYFRMPARCRRRPRQLGLPRRPGCREPRRCAGRRRWPSRRCNGRGSSAGPRRRAQRGARLGAAGNRKADRCDYRSSRSGPG